MSTIICANDVSAAGGVEVVSDAVPPFAKRGAHTDMIYLPW